MIPLPNRRQGKLFSLTDLHRFSNYSNLLNQFTDHPRSTMPRRPTFYFKADETEDHPQSDFECELACENCAFYLEDKQRYCSRTTCKTLPYCWQHTIEVYKMKVEPSCIRAGGVGEGLFAWNPKQPSNAVVFKKGDDILEYEGEVLDEETVDQRYTPDLTAPYAFYHQQTKLYTDAACARGLASYVNHQPKSRSNAGFEETQTDIRLVATRDIQNYEEIYASYGKRYRLSEEGVTSGTRWPGRKKTKCTKCKSRLSPTKSKCKALSPKRSNPRGS